MHLALDLELVVDTYAAVRARLVAQKDRPDVQLDEADEVLRLRQSRPIADAGPWREEQSYWLINGAESSSRLLVRARLVHTGGAVGLPPPNVGLPALLRELTEAKVLRCGERPLGSLLTCGPDRAPALVARLYNDETQCPTVLITDQAVGQVLAQRLGPLALVVALDEAALCHLHSALDGRVRPTRNTVRVCWPGLHIDRGPHHDRYWLAGRDPDAIVALADLIALKIGRTRARWSQTPQEDTIIVEAETRRQVAAESAAVRTRLEGARRASEAEKDAILVEASEILDSRDSLRVENKRLRDENAALRTRLERFEREARAKQHGPLTPVSTLREAVERAERTLPELAFGHDVMKGIAKMKADAGPPATVLRYLEALSELAQMKRSGATLKMTELAWLKARNVEAGGESETVRNSRKAQRDRKWHDGTKRRVFDFHLKPNGGTDTDRCVRIYYRWDETELVFRIGWVGRHP